MYLFIFFYFLSKITCVLVQGEESGASSRHSAIGHPAVFSRIGVIGGYLDDRGSWGAVGAQADSVQDRVEGRVIVIDVHHCDPHTSYCTQTTLYKKTQNKMKANFDIIQRISAPCHFSGAL